MTFSGSPQTPVSTGRIDACIDICPFRARPQTAYALPAASTATCGDWDVSSVDEIVSAGPHVPPGGLTAACARPENSQTAIAVPARVTAICGPVAPASESG